MSRRRPPRLLLAAAVDVALLAAAGAELLLTADIGWRVDFIAGTVAVAAILVRRRWAWIGFLLTLPAVAIADTLIPTLVTLYTVSAVTRRRHWLLGAAALAVVVLWIAPWGYEPRISMLYDGLFGLMFGVTPVALGQLVLARRDLTLQLIEVRRAQDQTQRMAAEELLAAERSRLAREMHDVVSHQVSLIAVQAGALQVNASDPGVRQTAQTIRRLCVRTLEELRQMVLLLRTGSETHDRLRPQPDISQLPRLVESSGIPVELRIDPDLRLAPAGERAIYRGAQEALTNIRKHAPGASATIRVERDGSRVVLTVENTEGTRSPSSLPGAGHGHIGLRERTELLGGEFTAQPTPQGYRLVISIPTTTARDGRGIPEDSGLSPSPPRARPSSREVS